MYRPKRDDKRWKYGIVAMQKFEHVILTRFNVSVDYSPSRLGLDLDWLTHRFELFERFCYPSVFHQSNPNFRWLVFFDSETPACFQEQIKAYADWKNFIPIYVDGMLTGRRVRQILLETLNPATQYLITTRLDNDDAISKDFVEQVQAEFNEQEFTFISFVNGYVLSDRKLYWFKYKANPFVSLVEKRTEPTPEGFKTVFSVAHDQLHSNQQVRQVITQPAWLQVIHGRNVSNRVRGIRHPITLLRQNFCIGLDELFSTDNSVLYWLDRGFGLLKLPLETMILGLPKETRAFLRNMILRN